MSETHAEQLLLALQALRGEALDVEPGEVIGRVVRPLVEAHLRLRFGSTLRDDLIDDAVQHVAERCWTGRCRATTPGQAVQFVRVAARNFYIDALRSHRRLVPLDEAATNDAWIDPSAGIVESLDLPRFLSRIQQSAGKKWPRIVAFLRSRVSAEGRLGDAAARQARSAGKRYLLDVARKMDLTEDERDLVRKLCDVALDGDADEDVKR